MKNETVLGTIYTNVSERFQRGLYPIARCIKASTLDLAVVLEVRGGNELADVKVIGQMDNSIDHTFESANRIYDVGGGGSYYEYLWRRWIATEDFS